MFDSDFVLASVSGFSDSLIDGLFSIRLFDADNRPVSIKDMGPPLLISEDLFPSIPFPAGGHLRFTAKLKDGVQIGRLRPYFTISCLGFKVFRDPLEEHRSRARTLKHLSHSIDQRRASTKKK